MGVELRHAAALGALGALAVAACLATACRKEAPPAPRAFDAGAAIRARLDREGPPIARTFYERRSFAPAWNDAADRDALLAALTAAASHGIDPRVYHVEELRRQSSAGAEGDAAASRDVALTRAALAHAGDLALGRGQPPAADAQARILAALEAGLREHALGHVFDSLAPSDPAYQRLRDALARYRGISAAGGWAAGEPSADALAKRLAVEGDRDLATFQRRHGIASTGILDEPTRAALGVPVDGRIEQIAVNLERWRRLPRDLGRRFLWVNVAGATLSAYRDGVMLLDMKVITGAQYTPTPLFADRITYVVLNPYWNIPATIAKKEILPKGPGYLRRHGIERDARGALRQKPGPRNPLGRIKFIFPNQFDVYLHDTPHGSLFDRRDRTLSHGCIRVERPVELAEFALDEPAKWTRERILAAIESGKTERVTLKDPLPVYILYWTAWVDADGTVEFRDDVYGNDRPLAETLATPIAA